MPSATRRTGASAWLVAIVVAATPLAQAEADTAMAAAVQGVPVIRTAVVDAALTLQPGSRSTLPSVVGGIAASASLTRSRTALGASVANAGRCDGPDAAALAAVLPVATDNGSYASGVVFAHGQVLTAAHAVKGASRFFVKTDKDFHLASLVVVDHEADLAVLAVDTLGIQPLPLAAADPSDREAVWAVGFPRAQGLAMSVGVFQKVRGGALHTSAAIDSGQSGGGLLGCSRGHFHLAGMLRGYGAYLSGDRYVKLENHSVSVAATTIHRFLAAYR